MLGWTAMGMAGLIWSGPAISDRGALSLLFNAFPGRASVLECFRECPYGDVRIAHASEIDE